MTEVVEGKQKLTLNDIINLTEVAEESATKELDLLKEKAVAATQDDTSPLFGIDAMKLQAQIAKGMDYDQAKNHNLSNWSKVCYHGDYDAVKHLISGRSAEEKWHLIETKESLMRFSSLFHVVKGACKKGKEGHIKIARYLLSGILSAYFTLNYIYITGYY